MNIERFYDTSSLLLLQEKVFDNPFYISFATLLELESIKTSSHKDEEIKYKARKIVRLLDNNTDKYTVIMDGKDICEELGLELSNDNIIISGCYKISKTQKISLYTEDLLMKLVASGLGINVCSGKNNLNNQYKGYISISGDSNYINDYMNNIDYSEWFINQYLIIHNTDDKKTSELRYNGETFVGLKLPHSGYIKAKNSLQRCALDLLMNKDITAIAILGGYGSGKSFLTMQMALYHVVEKGNQGKILGVREARGEGASVGFLRGSFAEKTEMFFKPLEQQLKGGEFELINLLNRGYLETSIPFYLKGTTYNDTIIVVDEAEDLNESQLRLIGTRVGENGKVYFSGDYEQSLIDKTENNGLVKMCNELKGNPMFGCIWLDDDVRSDTSKIFANLFKR